MSKRAKVAESTPKKPLTAAELIARKTSDMPAPPASALKELRILCTTNDAEPRKTMHVGRDQALEMLASHGVKIGHITLDKICRKYLNRKSYAQA